MMTQKNTLLTLLVTTVFLSACSGGTESGGSAGDSAETIDAIALISPLVGLYSLPDNWDGFPVSEAFFEVQEPDVSGVATALLFRTNQFSNCIETRASSGEIERDFFTDSVFLNDLFEFDRAILTGSGRNLVISLPEDLQDTDGDGNTAETAVLVAQRVDMMSSDLNFCE